MSGDVGIPVAVTARTEVAEHVVEFELRHPDGNALPDWRPGAHIDVATGDRMVRQYSLCGEPDDRGAYRIAVLKQPGGRGGSVWLHDRLREGDRLTIRGPRNRFPLERATSYVFLAGGIGVTPFLPMIRQAAKDGAEWVLHYGGRNRAAMAYADELGSTDAGRVRLTPADEYGFIDIEAAVAARPAESLVYCCGPEPMIAAAESVCARRGLRLRTERFSPKDSPTSTVNSDFTVHIASTGMEITVPADRSLVDVLTEAGIDVLTSCEEGTCGTCETTVLSGRPDHRDCVLTDEERAANDRMLICVSRSQTPQLVLDL
ncbi:MAG TPA: PDR/VanB family oxidoreductase [Amycolatopsis sp.]|nr:PDR/VanB family oxidoreductase [Amycolatopsis sp.]